MGDKLGWYQTVEGSLNAIGSSSTSAAEWGKFYNDAFVALAQVKPLEMLWSPVAGKAAWSLPNKWSAGGEGRAVRQSAYRSAGCPSRTAGRHRTSTRACPPTGGAEA